MSVQNRVVAQRFDLPERTLQVAAGGCVGNRYRANFDVLHVDPELPFMAVADGMGDGRGSTAAGRTTMVALVETVRAAGTQADLGTLRDGVAEAQRRVGAKGAELGELTGCTLTALLADGTGTGAWLAQIGDSRAYRLRDGLLELLTVDHTVAWLGVVHGWYAADSAAAAAARYQLTRYVGHPAQPEPDLSTVSLRPGDVYCLCTDGVADQLDYQRLRALLGEWVEPAEIVRRMLADTLAAGGRDNATAVVLRVDGR